MFKYKGKKNLTFIILNSSFWKKYIVDYKLVTEQTVSPAMFDLLLGRQDVGPY